MSVFDNAVTEFKSNFPNFYARGWGPTTKAERWNGRHAMFGWVALIATGYAQAHNLIPDFDKPVDLAQWGTLAILAGKQTISTGTSRRVAKTATLEAHDFRSCLLVFC
eukprot:scaffold7340_cov266-Pinguiococcus_pyrenoidosus.AAC.26